MRGNAAGVFPPWALSATAEGGYVRATIIWVLVLAIGFALMAISYWGLQKPAASGGPASAPASTSSTAAGRAAAESGRVKPIPFYMYVVGQGFLLLGGVALLIRFLEFLAPRTEGQVWHPAFAAIRRYRRLFRTVHIVYFGGVIVVAALAYHMPEVQGKLLRDVTQQAQSGQGLLGVAAKGYLQQNFALAAGLTLAVNFIAGSFLYITVPSFVVPGIGVAGAAFRAVLWGILLAPTHVRLAGAMLPHSFTLLLEGEGYVLAAFFAVLIPVYMLRPSEGPTVWRRYGRAVVLNLRGNLLVLIVLLVAALYEAAEVILMMKMGAK